MILRTGLRTLIDPCITYEISFQRTLRRSSSLRDLQHINFIRSLNW